MQPIKNEKQDLALQPKPSLSVLWSSPVADSTCMESTVWHLNSFIDLRIHSESREGHFFGIIRQISLVNLKFPANHLAGRWHKTCVFPLGAKSWEQLLLRSRASIFPAHSTQLSFGLVFLGLCWQQLQFSNMQSLLKIDFNIETLKWGNSFSWTVLWSSFILEF